MSRSKKLMNDARFFEDQPIQSTFNEAQNQMYRLHNTYINCNTYSTKGDLWKWHWELEVLRRELWADIVELNCESERIQLKALNRLIQKYKDDSKKLIYLLGKKEEVLRVIQDSVGKGARREKVYEKMM